MLASQVIARIKSSTHDISDEYSEAQCLDFLNSSIQQVSALLISAKFPSLVKEMTVHNGDNLPVNYMASAGSYPLRMTGGQAFIVDGSSSVRFRYFATPDLITTSGATLPYDHAAINEVIVKLAIMLALNENEYDIGQDSKLYEALQAAIAAGMQQ